MQSRQQKSVNLQYNIIRWFAGPMGQTTHLMFKVLFFFIKSCTILCKDPFNLCALSLSEIMKKKYLERQTLGR